MPKKANKKNRQNGHKKSAGESELEKVERRIERISTTLDWLDRVENEGGLVLNCDEFECDFKSHLLDDFRVDLDKKADVSVLFCRECAGRIYHAHRTRMPLLSEHLKSRTAYLSNFRDGLEQQRVKLERKEEPAPAPKPKEKTSKTTRGNGRPKRGDHEPRTPRKGPDAIEAYKQRYPQASA